jgi:fibronectin type 3 domain-containing protein
MMRLPADASMFKGYAVYRSFAADHGYRQINDLVTERRFTDKNVAKGMTLYYRVQAFDKNGDRSPLSNTVTITLK